MIETRYQILKYTIIGASSKDPDHPLEKISSNNPQDGWHSARFCSYPQEIIIEFHSRVNIKQINILIHEKKIPSIIEFVNCFEQKINEQKYYREKKNRIYKIII